MGKELLYSTGLTISNDGFPELSNADGSTHLNWAKLCDELVETRKSFGQFSIRGSSSSVRGLEKQLRIKRRNSKEKSKDFRRGHRPLFSVDLFHLLQDLNIFVELKSFIKGLSLVNSAQTRIMSVVIRFDSNLTRCSSQNEPIQFNFSHMQSTT